MVDTGVTGVRKRRRRAWWLALPLLAALLSSAPAVAAEDPFDAMVRADLDTARAQLERSVAGRSASSYLWVTESGEWRSGVASGWYSGFFPGALWLMYEDTGNDVWRTRAEKWQSGIDSQKTVSNSDLGFMFLNSFVHGSRLTEGAVSAAYKETALKAAATLATRFDDKVGSVEARWPPGDDTDFNVTSDVMPNIELLFWGARNGGTPAWRDLAISHVKNAQRDHVRPDGGSYHVVNYDPADGTVQWRGTAQGYADDSTWTRGQAWAIYGFVVAHRETQDVQFLDTANRMIDYFMTRLPPDRIPRWDFDDPKGGPPDTSAAAVVASALLELQTLDAGRSAQHLANAKALLTALSSPTYLSSSASEPSILLHGTGNNRSGFAVDTGLIWGDYYFVEALMRYRRTMGLPPPDTTSPTVTLTAPAAGDTVSGGVNVTAEAGDDRAVTRVDFLVDGVVKSSSSTAPYGFAWDTTTAANGSHALSAKAYDAGGNAGTSATVAVTVKNPVPPVLAANSSTSTGSGSATSKSLSHTVPSSGANRYLVVGVAWKASSPPRLTALTYAGVPLKQVGPTLSPTSAMRAALFTLADPARGTNSVVVKLSARAGIVMSARTFTGVDAAASAAPVTNLGNSTLISLAVPSAATELVVDWATNAGNSATATVGANQTQDANQRVTASGYDLRGLASRERGASSTTMSWTLSGSRAWGAFGLSLKPAP